MKKNMKKLLSLLLVVCFAFTMIPISGITASAEAAEVTLSDGSVWLMNNGSDITVTPNSSGYYSITTANDSSAESYFRMMTKTRYPALTSSFRLSVDYRGEAASFGFSTDYSIDGLRGLSHSGKVEFYRIESGNTTNLQMRVDGTTYTVAKFTATRSSLCEIKIVKENGSYYISYKGNVVNGSAYDDVVKEAVKLENYFPAEFLENNGMLHFFFTATKISSSANTRFIVHDSIGAYSKIYSHTTSGDANNPAAWVIAPDGGNVTYTDGKYTFASGTGGNTATFGIPVTKVETGAKESGVFISTSNYSSLPTATQYTNILFSNDPDFATYDKVQFANIANSSSVHVIYNSATIGALTNLFKTTQYKWSFLSDGSTVTGLKIDHNGTSGLTLTINKPFNNLEVGKPIYMQISKGYSSGITATTDYIFKVADTSYIDDITALETSITDAAAANDPIATKTVVDAFYANDLHLATSHDVRAAAGDLIIAYYEAVVEAAATFDAKVNALPAIEDLLYQDKATVEALRAEYDAFDDEVKNNVTTLATLEAYEEAVAVMENDGYYRTSNGDIYRVNCDLENIALSSDENNGAIKTSVIGEKNKAGSKLGIITTEKYPIVSGKYEMQQNFGTLDASGRFGIAISDDADIYDRVQNGRFALYRMESGNKTSFYVIIDGKATLCYSLTATRNRIWKIGVTKQDGSWYMTIDGVVINGAAYDETVQNALKLENYFGEEFLTNNGMVHFFMYAASMNAGSYLRPAVEVKDGLIADMTDRMGDQNGGYANIVEYNLLDSSAASDGTNTVYNFNVPSAGSITVAEPINPDGFSIKAKMPLASGNQTPKFAFSNDPTFTDGTEIEFTIYQFTNGQNTVYWNGAERTPRFSGFYGEKVTRTLSFVEQTDGTYRLRIYTPGNDLTASGMDFSSLIGKPIYLKITGGAGIEPVITLTNTTTTLSATLPENAEDVDAAKTALDAFYADPARYTSYDAMVKATELYNEVEARRMGAEVDERVEAIGVENKTEYSNHLDVLKVLSTSYSKMTVQQKTYFSADAQAMINYYEALAGLSAENFVTIRQMLTDSAEDNVVAYDYYYDDELSIKDLVRMKKAAVSAASSYDKAVYTNVSNAPKMVYAHTFGAKGDGVTDDGPAVAAALTELTKSGAGSILVFEKNKTYNIASLPMTRDTRPAIFEVKNCAGLEIDGNGSEFIIDDAAKDRTFGWFQNTADCKITDMTFDYETSPAFNATYVSSNPLSQTITLKADRNIGLSDGETYTTTNDTGNFLNFGNNWWGVVKDAVSRSHVYIESYEMISSAEGTFKLKCANSSEYTKFISEIMTSGMICPMPGKGHRSGSTERGFTVLNNKNMEIENITFNAVYRFGMFINNNEGTLKLTNVDFTANDDIHYTSWRDAFHVKDNKAKIIWDGCESHYNYDDVFNISASTMTVDAYNAETKELDLSGYSFDISVGDTINIINVSTGEDYGETVVESVISQDEDKVILKDALDITATGENVYAFFTNRCAPDSEIKNCDFSGTFRFRGPLTVTNTKFLNMRTWMNLEGASEGPVPQGIVFRNCEITSSYSRSSIIIGGITNGDDVVFDSGNRQFHTDITFENCTIDESSLSISASDKNYVKIRNCTDTDGSAIADRN